jgi:hypothetical protein
VLTVTGPAPIPIGQGAAELVKFNPHHDEKGRFATADGARGGGLAAVGTALETAGPAAELLLANPATAGAAAMLGLGALAYYAYNHASASSEPDNPKDKPPPIAEAQEEPAAAAGAPAPDPDDEGQRSNVKDQNDKQDQKKGTVSEKAQGRAPSEDNPEDYRLGFDPATGKFVSEEASTGRQLEQLLGKQLQRYPGGGLDWVDEAGTTYDAVGPVDAKYFDAQSFTDSIRKHLLKSDFTVIDFTGMDADQVSKVEDYISGLPPEARAKLLKLGF